MNPADPGDGAENALARALEHATAAGRWKLARAILQELHARRGQP